jgi:hypothetical protein
LSLGAELAVEAKEISAEFAIPVDVDVSWRRGFDGMATAVAVITIVVSGVGGGLLSSIGSDFWSLIKGIFRKVEQQERIDCQVIVIHRDSDREIRFMCRTNQQTDIDRLIAALGDVRRLPQADDHADLTFDLDADGNWRELK